MKTWEEIGRVVDREVERLKEFFHTELKPRTVQGTIEALRTASARLSELADDLEKKRTAGSGSEKPQ